MLSPEQGAKFDQAITYCSEVIPPALWRFYCNLLKEGFSETQAMAFTIAYLNSFTPHK